MSIAIIGATMPNDCRTCKFVRFSKNDSEDFVFLECFFTNEDVFNIEKGVRGYACPLVTIPDNLLDLANSEYQRGWFNGEKAAESRRKRGKWIPVTERLPENDVPVLLSCKCGTGAYICDGFHTEKYSTPIPFYADIDADYNEEADEYYFPEGWWEIIKNWDDYSCVAIEDTITHWMPLPQPPEDGES